MVKKQDGAYEIDLLQLLKTLWQNIRLIILTTILTTAIAGSISYFLITPEYQANIMVYVNNSSISIGSSSLSISSGDISAAKSLVDTYIVILKSRTTLNHVIRDAGLDYDYKELSGMIKASAVNSTEIFSITVTDTNPDEAKLIANTIAEVLPDTIADIVDGASVRIVDYAVKPVQKSAPSNTKNAMIGFVIGLILSCGFVIIRSLMDDVVRDEDFLTNNFDIPILAVIPDLSAKSDGKYKYKDDKYKNYKYSGKEKK